MPASLMFPLVHLLCQISYQMEENFLLRKREERGTLASITLFNLTSDSIVRDIIFHDTKEARERHIYPVYHKKQWHTAVLLTHFFRQPSSPAEDGNGQVQLLKVDQILDQMNVWILNRGGSIYLDLQMSRQQLKAKRSKASKDPVAKNSKRKSTAVEGSRKRSKNAHDTLSSQDMNASNSHPQVLETLPSTCSYQHSQWMDGDESESLELDENTNASDMLSCLIMSRIRSISASDAKNSLLSNTIATKYRQTRVSSCGCERASNDGKCIGTGFLRVTDPKVKCERTCMNEDMHGLYVSSTAALCISIVSTQPRRVIGSVATKILQTLEEDIKSIVIKDGEPSKVSDMGTIHLLSGIMCGSSATALVPAFMNSLAIQLESMLRLCLDHDKQPNLHNNKSLQHLRQNIVTRLHLITTAMYLNQTSATLHARNRIAQALCLLLGTFSVSATSDSSLFQWIIDLLASLQSEDIYNKQMVRYFSFRV